MSKQNRTQYSQRQAQPKSVQPRRQQRDDVQQSDEQGGDLQTNLLNAVKPAFQEFRTYVEGSPMRAAAIGAIAGGALMTLFSTEKGRQFVRLAYDYANPMIAKYAREYVSKAAGDMAESAIAH